MKKLFLSSFIIIASFFFVNSVGASDYTSKNVNILTSDFLKHTILANDEEYLDYAQNDSLKNYFNLYIAYINDFDFNNKKYLVIVGPSEVYLYYWNDIAEYNDLKLYLNFSYNNYFDRIDFGVYYNFNFQKKIDSNFINKKVLKVKNNEVYVDKDLKVNFIQELGHINYNISNFHPDPSNYKYSGKIYKTNCELYYSSFSLDSRTQHINTFNFIDNDNNSYSMNNDTLLFKNNFNLNFLRKIYEYHNIINCKDKSHIVFNFIPDGNQFDLNFTSSFVSNNLPKPYLEYESSLNGYSFISAEDFSSDIEDTKSIDLNGNELYQYSGHFGVDFVDLPGSLSLIIDVTKYDGDITIEFTSSYNFIDAYELLSDYDSNKVVVDMSNVYGLYLMPRVKDSDLFESVYMSGLYNIEIRKNFLGVGNLSNDDITFDSTPFFIDNYDKSFFQYLYRFRDNALAGYDSDTLNYLTYFQNIGYKENSFIEFDSRYFNYAIKQYEFDSPVIIDPNSNVSHQLYSEDNINYSNNDELNTNNFFSLLKNAMSRFTNVIKSIFKLVSTFFYSLPSILQLFFVLQLFFIVLLLFLKFLL